MREKDLKETGLADMAYKVDKDHEVQMARADLYKIAKYGIKLHEMLAGISEEQGLDGWVQAKITKAADYLGSVYHHLDYETKFDEVTEAKKQAAPEKMKVTDADKKAGTEAYKRMKAGDDRYVDATTKKVKETNEAEKRWKQTSMSPQEAIAKYGKENVKVKKGALRNGDDMVEVFVESMNEAGGYYTQPVYDMIKQHGIEKVMHELLTNLDADVIQSFLSRANFDEARSSASDQAAKAGAYNGGKSGDSKGDGKSDLAHRLTGDALQKHRDKRSAEYEADLVKKRAANAARLKSYDESEVNDLTALYINENDISLDQLENMTEEELNELIGKAIGGAFKLGAKAVVGSARLASKGAKRMSTSGRADAANNKAAALEKKKKDRESLTKAKDRVRAAKDALRAKKKL